jgi:hypothetical protein
VFNTSVYKYTIYTRPRQSRLSTADYDLIRVVSLTTLRRTQVKTLLATIHVAIVGCHGNPVYRAVTWIPICICVTWLPKFLTYGRFPWEAPTAANKNQYQKKFLVGVKRGRNVKLTSVNGLCRQCGILNISTLLASTACNGKFFILQDLGHHEFASTLIGKTVRICNKK